MCRLCAVAATCCSLRWPETLPRPPLESGERAGDEILTHIRLIPTNLQWQPCGEHSHLVRDSESLLAQAKELRAQGSTMRASEAILGPHYTTVIRWLSVTRLVTAARLDARVFVPNSS
jgi:hypothetical protein